LLTSWLVACGSSDPPATAGADASAPGADGAAPADGGAGPDAATEAGPSCLRALAPADRARKVVVSHPFQAAGVKGKRFEVLDLAASGALAKTGTTFDMGTANASPIVFTPDGRVGLVAQEDGSVGVFEIADGGAVRVVHAAFKDKFYAGAIVLDEAGTRAFVVDANTANNGGGVHALAIRCDGTLAYQGLLVPGGTANAMTLLPTDPSKAVLFAGKAFASAAGKETHLVDLAGPTLVASGTAFPGGDAIASSIAVTPDGKYALVADDSVVAGNRVAVVALPGMTLVQTLPTEYPAAVVASPFGNAALVLNDDSTDHVSVLAYDASNAAAPFTNTGRMTYAFPRPQIPTTAVAITRGALKGRVLVSENLAVRQLQFTPAGGVTDTEKFSMGAGIPEIVGVVGVQP
jgi:DNA-binding beta-propeller fold protein YncE